MSSSPSSRIAFRFDPVTGEPCAQEVTDTTAWPSASAALQALQTVLEIHNRGYAGLKFGYLPLNEAEITWSRNVNLASPEGQLVNFVMGLAEYGYALPKDIAIALLRHIYQSEDLPLPTARPRNEQIYTSENEAKK